MLYNIIKGKDCPFRHHQEEEFIQYVPNSARNIQPQSTTSIKANSIHYYFFIKDAKLKGIIITTLAAYPKYRNRPCIEFQDLSSYAYE